MKLNLPLLSPWVWWTFAGLGLALLASGGTNLYQLQARRADAAACEAARLKVVADTATGTAAAEKERADQIAAIALDSSEDEAKRLEALDKATLRISGAASRYATAKTAAPLPKGCKATPDRVEAVNTARGHQ